MNGGKIRMGRKTEDRSLKFPLFALTDSKASAAHSHNVYEKAPTHLHLQRCQLQSISYASFNDSLIEKFGEHE